MPNRSARLIYWIGVVSLLPAQAWAIFNISSPAIEPGIVGVELRNRFDIDHRSNEAGFRDHLLRLDYGVNDWFAVELNMLEEKPPQEGYFYRSTELEGKFRLLKPQEAWVDLSVKLSYERMEEEGRADQVKSKFLLQRKQGEFTHTANVTLAQEVGPDATRDALVSYGWRSKYNLSTAFQPGFEYYGSVGELGRTGPYADQQHRIGPMFFGEIMPGLSYQAGYLFGISRAAEDGSVKLFLRYEFGL